MPVRVVMTLLGTSLVSYRLHAIPAKVTHHEETQNKVV